MPAVVELAQMLEARERRALRQQALFQQYGLPLVSFTMNIPGPIKNSPLIRRGFRLGRELLLGQLDLAKAPIPFSEEWDEDTGCEGFYVVDLPPRTLKAITCGIEEHSELGRLFDMDVLTPEGEKLDRPVPRRCLICGGPAKACARSRTHSVPQLQAKTKELLESALLHHDRDTAAGLAIRALLYEVCTTPKPGLVDRNNNGSHRDMDIFTFLDSTSSLWPYFSQCVQAGRTTADQPPHCTLAALRIPGQLAEASMFAATHGVNTHKGAIYTLGLVCGALGRLDVECWKKPEQVLAQVAAMTQGTVERELSGLTWETARTSGQKLYLQYGVTGVRGQAEAGFPGVLEHGLPTLEEGLTRGLSLNEAGCAAMLTILAHTVDTNMIARGGYALQQERAAQLRELLARTPYPDRAALEELDQAYIRENLSPGGSADLLALCYLLHFLKEA